MEIKYVDSKDMKNLEDYATSMITALISLRTLEGYHIAAVKLGILKEDQACRSNTIVWDFIRLRKLLTDQLESVLELLPDDFDPRKLLRDIKQKSKRTKKVEDASL
jgi:hypothetical protein